MLTRLAIRNIVLIEQCEIPLAPGLCVLTGETGAGKSILLDALGLALGQRSDARLVRTGSEQASVTATFDLSSAPLAQATLDMLGFDPTDELIIRRTLSADGKTRCFLNDVAVSVAALKTLGETLVEISGQHDGRGLLDASTHRDLLDAFGELQASAQATSAAYAAWKEARDALAASEEAVRAAEREKDYLLHVEKELSTLGLSEGEEDELATTRTRMMQSEKLAETLKDAQTELQTGKGAAALISAAQRTLARSSLATDGRFAVTIDALDRAGTELYEAETALAALMRGTEYDPAKLERIEERLFAIRAAARKHNVTPEELLPLLASVSAKLKLLQDEVHHNAALHKQVSVARDAYHKAALLLSDARKQAAKELEQSVAAEMESLKMAGTRFHVVFESLDEDRWSASGLDQIYFQAATNKGAALAPLSKIASGGELSRFMLAMKVALARVKSTPTLIFDEIDTGTGGAVADAIGKRLALLGATHQVLVVTHLPQVAAQGIEHLRILKEERGGATFTEVVRLGAKARKEELARMLSGADITAEARKAAEKLLQAAG